MSSEAGAVAVTGEGPATIDSLVHDLTSLGVRRGSVLLVHASLSALGWVAGGAAAVVDALLAVLGADGTLVVPTHTGDLSDPAGWQNPPVPATWWPTIRSSMAPFRPDAALPRKMGAVTLAALLRDGSLRSDHPHVSFAAIGPRALAIVHPHALQDGLGERSPLARLEQLDADVLLLGVGHDANTSLHLAEHRATWPTRATTPQGAPVLEGGKRRWATWQELDYEADDFAAIGEHLEVTGLVRLGPVGMGTGRLMAQRAVVAAAASWMTEHRA